jgi:ABC-type multidrug transport system fused ATPase/permease subunit
MGLNTLTLAQLSDDAYDETVGRMEYKEVEQTENTPLNVDEGETVWNFGALGDILLIILVVGVLIFILYFIVSKLTANKSNKKIERALQFVEEHLDEVDATEIDGQLNDSIQKERYNQAVRFLFLKNLKALNEKSLIYWKKHKTNYTYTQELPELFREAFSGTAIWFDLARYSRHVVSTEEFETVHDLMKSFHNQIQQYEQK